MLTAALTLNKRLISLLAALLVSTSASAQTYDPTLLTPQISGVPTTMTPLNLGDDNTRQISLGFEFEYWGQTFTDVWVSSNGFVSFESPANLCCNGQPIDQAQRNTIYAYWSDLISYTGNPYYSISEGYALFGWYGVQEYGTNNSNTFEIGLFSNGNIQFNYGSLSASGGHDFTAGITGPEADDNVPLFYGRNPQFLQNQSGLLTYGSPLPEEVEIDCNATPLHPSCPQVSIPVTTGAPDPTESAIESALEAAVDSVEQAAMEETQEEVLIEDIAEIEQVLETAQEALETAEELVEADVATETDELVADEEPVEEDVIEELVSERDLEDLRPDPERLSPDELAALAVQASQDDKLNDEPKEVEALAEQSPEDDEVDDQPEASEALEAQSPENESVVDEIKVVEELVAQGPEDESAVDETEAMETLASLELENPADAVEGQDASSGVLEQEVSNQLVTALEESGQGMQSAFFEEAAEVSQASAFESGSQSSQSFGSFQMRVDFGSSTSAVAGGGIGAGVGSSPVESAISAAGPMSMSTTFEILSNAGGGTNAAPVAVSASSEKSENEMAEGQSETINEMGSVPAFNAYRQVSLSDRADFYAIRDIYRNRRLRDANFEMYRMTQTNDAKWREIVDAQYK